MIEYKVRPVTRFMVTRFEASNSVDENGKANCGVGSRCLGTFDSEEVAYNVAYSLARADSERLGLPPDSMEVIYPETPNGVDTHNIY